MPDYVSRPARTSRLRPTGPPAIVVIRIGLRNGDIDLDLYPRLVRLLAVLISLALAMHAEAVEYLFMVGREVVAAMAHLEAHARILLLGFIRRSMYF